MLHFLCSGDQFQTRTVSPSKSQNWLKKRINILNTEYRKTLLVNNLLVPRPIIISTDSHVIHTRHSPYVINVIYKQRDCKLFRYGAKHDMAICYLMTKTQSTQVYFLKFFFYIAVVYLKNTIMSQVLWTFSGIIIIILLIKYLDSHNKGSLQFWKSWSNIERTLY